MIRLQAISCRNRQRGVSLIMAIFILVALSLLGAAMINLTISGSDTVAREVISTRALFAAQSGAQLKLNQIFVPGGAVDTSACGASTFSLGGLTDCQSANVTCELIVIDGVNYFNITSSGQCGPVGDQAVRVVEVQASDGS